jgi:hypothetical protein
MKLSDSIIEKYSKYYPELNYFLSNFQFDDMLLVNEEKTSEVSEDEYLSFYSMITAVIRSIKEKPDWMNLVTSVTSLALLKNLESHDESAFSDPELARTDLIFCMCMDACLAILEESVQKISDYFIHRRKRAPFEGIPDTLDLFAEKGVSNIARLFKLAMKESYKDGFDENGYFGIRQTSLNTFDFFTRNYESYYRFRFLKIAMPYYIYAFNESAYCFENVSLDTDESTDAEFSDSAKCKRGLSDYISRNHRYPIELDSHLMPDYYAVSRNVTYKELSLKKNKPDKTEQQKLSQNFFMYYKRRVKDFFALIDTAKEYEKKTDEPVNELFCLHLFNKKTQLLTAWLMNKYARDFNDLDKYTMICDGEEYRVNEKKRLRAVRYSNMLESIKVQLSFRQCGIMTGYYFLSHGAYEIFSIDRDPDNTQDNTPNVLSLYSGAYFALYEMLRQQIHNCVKPTLLPEDSEELDIKLNLNIYHLLSDINCPDMVKDIRDDIDSTDGNSERFAHFYKIGYDR